MKTKDIAQKYNLELERFDYYLETHKTADIKISLWGNSIENDIEGYVEKYKQYMADRDLAQKAVVEEAERERIAEEEKARACAQMLITSGFSFDGYKITKYSGYISGDDAISIDRGVSGLFSSATDVGKSLTDSLVKIRRQALKELKEAAYDLGCNAVIGVDFDYITLDPETANSHGGTTYLPYVFCVTANGNAVIIEKDE